MVTVLMAILIFMGIGWQFAFEQWGLIMDRKNTEESISLPLAYSNKQVFSTVIDWGAPNKAYGVANLSTTSFTVVAPVTPFSVYFVSVGV